MVKFNNPIYALLSTFLAGAFLFSSIILHAAAPSWTSGTPKIVNGATSMDINVSLDQKGKVYYAVYLTAPASPTPASVKKDATANIDNNLVENGIITIDQANTNVYAYVKGMNENTTYYTLLVAENAAGELQEIKKIAQLTNIFPKRQSELYYPSNIMPGAIVSYLAYFPEEYYRDSTHNFPLLVILHGTGEKCWPYTSISNNYNALTKYGPPKYIAEGKDYPFVVISPQCAFDDWDDYSGTVFNGKFIDDIVYNMQRRYHLDPSRNYISGLSMGGGGAFAYFQNFPDKVAAAIPIAGWPSAPSLTFNSRNVGLWVFQGEYDDGAKMTDFVTSVNTCIPAPFEPAKIIVYQGGGHDAWTATYDNSGPGIAPDNIYNWLLRHVKGNNFQEDGTNNSPLVYGGSDLTLGLNPGKITLQGKASDSDGKIVSYQWKQMDGPQNTYLYDDATPTATVSNLSPGKYTFRLTAEDNGGRSAYDEIIIIVTSMSSNIITGVNTVPSSNQILLSPNPVVDNIHLSLPQDLVGKITLTLSDIQGRVIALENTYTGSGEVAMNYNVQDNLPKGVYSLKVTSESGKSQVVKLIKE